MTNQGIKIIKGILTKAGYKVVKVREPLSAKGLLYEFKVTIPQFYNYDWYTWEMLNVLANQVENNLHEVNVEHSYKKTVDDFLDLSDFDEISELEEVRGLEIEEAKKEIEKEVNLLPDVEEFVFAGKAIFTLESKKTGNHYTYRMSQCKDRKELYFVGLLTGTDNQASYQYIGIVQNGEFKLTKKSLLPMESIPVKAFKFFIDKLQKINEIKDLEFHHMGYCGKCGKSLTTPESLKTGLGPTCRKGI